ncbi:MAG: hypothetical protein ACM3N0_12060 [Chloroflexota bacterium]
MSSGTAASWTCDGCAVSISRIDGKRAPLPTGWERSAEGWLCLLCSRERAAEAALETAPGNSTRDERAKLRRRALIEFEVRRVPELTDSAIARACRSSAAAVAATRKRIGERQPDVPSSRRRSTLRQAATR